MLCVCVIRTLWVKTVLNDKLHSCYKGEEFSLQLLSGQPGGRK